MFRSKHKAEDRPKETKNKGVVKIYREYGKKNSA